MDIDNGLNFKRDGRVRIGKQQFRENIFPATCIMGHRSNSKLQEKCAKGRTRSLSGPGGAETSAKVGDIRKYVNN